MSLVLRAAARALRARSAARGMASSSNQHDESGGAAAGLRGAPASSWSLLRDGWDDSAPWVPVQGGGGGSGGGGAAVEVRGAARAEVARAVRG